MMWHAIGRQLGHPHGWLGRALGRLMRLANRQPNRLALDALSPASGETVLELGFGPGEALAAMTRRGCRAIHGVDRSAAMVRQAARRNRTAVAAGHIRLRQGDFAALPYPDAFFDKVLAVNVVYFWHDATAVIGEIRRVLRPGGTLVLYATDARSMRKWKFAGTQTHRQFDDTALAGLLIGGGFSPALVSVMVRAMAGGVTGLVAVAKTPLAANDEGRIGPHRRTQSA